MPTVFMQLAGIPSISLGVTSTTQQQLNGIELALVLDVTGSMNDPDPSGGTKLEALGTASDILLDIIYGEDDAIDDVSVSVVPYKTEVNLGSDRTDLLTGFDEAAFGLSGWKGCVEARDAPSTKTIPHRPMRRSRRCSGPPSAAPTIPTMIRMLVVPTAKCCR